MAAEAIQLALSVVQFYSQVAARRGHARKTSELVGGHDPLESEGTERGLLLQDGIGHVAPVHKADTSMARQWLAQLERGDLLKDVGLALLITAFHQAVCGFQLTANEADLLQLFYVHRQADIGTIQLFFITATGILLSFTSQSSLSALQFIMVICQVRCTRAQTVSSLEALARSAHSELHKPTRLHSAMRRLYTSVFCARAFCLSLSHQPKNVQLRAKRLSRLATSSCTRSACF